MQKNAEDLGSCLKGRVEPFLGETGRLGELLMTGSGTVEMQRPAPSLGVWAGQRGPRRPRGSTLLLWPVFPAPRAGYPGAEFDDSPLGRLQALHMPPV